MTIHFGDSTSQTTAASSVDTSNIRPKAAGGGGTYTYTYSENFVGATSANIDPESSNSSILVIASGMVQGQSNGNNTGTRSYAQCYVTRGNQQISGTAQGSYNDAASVGYATVDTNNHGGSAVQYQVKYRRIRDGNRSNNAAGRIWGYSVALVEVL